MTRDVPPSPPDTRKPLRRDAAQNYARVVAAAREVFAEAGIEAGMEAIAARAGVGVGTVYRRFPSKDALIDELVRLILDDLCAAATAALDHAGGAGLEQFLRAMGRALVEHRRYANELLGPLRSTQTEALRGLIGKLHRQAVEHAAVDSQVTLDDVLATCWALRGVVEATADAAPGAWERHLAIHLAGLRLVSIPSLSARPDTGQGTKAFYR